MTIEEVYVFNMIVHEIRNYFNSYDIILDVTEHDINGRVILGIDDELHFIVKKRVLRILDEF